MVETVTKSEPTIISNSEVNTFLSCERKHYYAHGMNIAPKSYGTSLTRGIIGHEALAEYFQAIKDADTQDQAKSKALRIIDGYAAYGGDMEMLGGLRTLVDIYLTNRAPEQLKLWRIVEVEKYYELPVTDRLSYGMRLDLMIQWLSGRRMGELGIVDHKFVYNFYGADAIQMDPQLPKYMGTAWKNNLNVTHAILNQLRWRETKENKMDWTKRFREDPVMPSPPRVRNIMREQITASERILERKNLPLEEQSKLAVRTMGKMTCDRCSFVGPCSAELENQNIALMVMTEYKPNTYGYTPEDRVEDE